MSERRVATFYNLPPPTQARDEQLRLLPTPPHLQQIIARIQKISDIDEEDRQWLITLLEDFHKQMCKDHYNQTFTFDIPFFETEVETLGLLADVENSSRDREERLLYVCQRLVPLIDSLVDEYCEMWRYGDGTVKRDRTVEKTLKTLIERTPISPALTEINRSAQANKSLSLQLKLAIFNAIVYIHRLMCLEHLRHMVSEGYNAEEYPFEAAEIKIKGIWTRLRVKDAKSQADHRLLNEQTQPAVVHQIISEYMEEWDYRQESGTSRYTHRVGAPLSTEPTYKVQLRRKMSP